MSRRARRETEVFSLSLLDVVTCGFGAIILLLMIARTGDAPVLEVSPEPLDAVVRDLQTQLFQIRGETTILNRDLNARHEQISIWEEKIAILQGELEQARRSMDEIKDQNSVNAVIKGELELALQELTAEMKLLLARKESIDTGIIGGIPVDSEYVVFVIDTSGSMQSHHWDRMIAMVNETLDAYPTVKGMQIMSDMGEYMITGKRRQWIKDTPALRRTILNTLRNWAPFSISSPVGGILEAVRAFRENTPGKVSIYVFGDEFTGDSIRQVIRTVDQLNPRDEAGNTKIRIHGVGFPAVANAHADYQFTNRRFATLMREIAYRNNGTFVGLN
ncbi:MAG: VWA domain-containing protein [Gammaproteobacteria bacterium]|nr:MAG: VWA domain-containing protein [Gammaproteobacteria bacterium]